MKDIKEKIIEELSEIKRPGIKKLIKWLEESDFFTAPASSKHHLCKPGGLAEHSLNVYELLKFKSKAFNLKIDKDTIRICGLLHDVCKIGIYLSYSMGRYGINESEKYSLGHGEKSIFLLQKYIDLTEEEACAIRWHMQSFDISTHFNYPNGYSFRRARSQFPLVVALFTADYEASELIEK